MRKSHRKFFKAGVIILLAGVATVILHNRLDDKSSPLAGNVRKSHLNSDFLRFIKQEITDLDPEDKKWVMKDIHDSVPGKLVCVKRKPVPPGSLSEESQEVESDIDLRLARLKSVKTSRTRLSPKRLIGCCPAGNPYGSPYKVGHACCVDEIFDVATHFCCTVNGRVLQLNSKNLDYCHPLDGVQYCRIEDLEGATTRGMNFNCMLNNKNKPVHCEFQCPHGSKPKKGATTATCNTEGVFDNVPECCQGCQQDFRLNLIFLIQIDVQTSSSNILRQSLKKFVSYFKIGQKNIRVGFRLVGGNDNHPIYSNPAAVQKAIDEMSLATDSNGGIGASLLRLAESGFNSMNKQRPEVDNLVVAILQGSSSDSIYEGAEKLKKIARVISINVGNTTSNADPSVIASSTSDALQVTDIYKLSDVSEALHDNVCGTNCL